MQARTFAPDTRHNFPAGALDRRDRHAPTVAPHTRHNFPPGTSRMSGRTSSAATGPARHGPRRALPPVALATAAHVTRAAQPYGCAYTARERGGAVGVAKAGAKAVIRSGDSSASFVLVSGVAAVLFAASVVTAACGPSTSGASGRRRGPDAEAGGHLRLPARDGPRLVRSPRRAVVGRLRRPAPGVRGPGEVGGADRRHDEDGALPGRELERERRRDGLDVQAAPGGHVPGARVARGHRGGRGRRPALPGRPRARVRA